MQAVLPVVHVVPRSLLRSLRMLRRVRGRWRRAPRRREQAGGCGPGARRRRRPRHGRMAGQQST
jgi:hypothetical protein